MLALAHQRPVEMSEYESQVISNLGDIRKEIGALVRVSIEQQGKTETLMQGQERILEMVKDLYQKNETIKDELHKLQLKQVVEIAKQNTKTTTNSLNLKWIQKLTWPFIIGAISAGITYYKTKGP